MYAGVSAGWARAYRRRAWRWWLACRSPDDRHLLDAMRYAYATRPWPRAG